MDELRFFIRWMRGDGGTEGGAGGAGGWGGGGGGWHKAAPGAWSRCSVLLCHQPPSND